MTYDFRLSCTLPAPPEEVYGARLDSARHSAMTGAPATVGQRAGDFAPMQVYFARENGVKRPKKGA